VAGPSSIARVEKDVRNRVPNLARRPQHVDVAAICEHAAGAVKHPVHAARQARGHRLEPASQIPRTSCLDDHVYVVALDRVVNEPERPALASLPPASLQLGDEPGRTQRRNVLSHLERDMTRKTRCQRRPPAMRIAT